jgi:uncharacterized protein (DUF952 family)
MRVFKILTQEQADGLKRTGRFEGSPADLKDGYIHFSTAVQVATTAQKHFQNDHNLWLATIDGTTLGERLVFEPARGGDLFPHLYDHLSLDQVLSLEAVPVGDDGKPHFGALLP